MLDRRQFLRTTAAGIALGSLPRTFAADEKSNEFAGFTVGVQSYSFRNFNLEQTLERIRDLGLRHVEFYNRHVPLNTSEEQMRAVLALCRRYEITPIAFGVEGFTRDHDANRRKFEFARALGVRTLSADPDPDSFDSLDRLVAEFNISIAIHPHGPVGNNRLHR